MIRNAFTGNMILLLAVSLSGCMTTGAIPAEDILSTGNKETRELVNRVKSINAEALQTIAVTFEVDGAIKKKKFKSLGKANFDRAGGKMYISFLDFIFKSPLTRVFIDGSEIVLYFPVNKELVKENAATIKLRNYNNIDVDIPFNILYELLTGSIPLIKKYAVKERLTKKSGNYSFLVLENSDFYETIVFDKGYPDRIKLVNKKSKSVAEIYLQKPMRLDKRYFFRRIIMVQKAADVRLTLKFKSIKLNQPVKVKSIKELKVPRDARIITR